MKLTKHSLNSDNDMVVSDSPDKVINQISIYAARGTLIESEGPTWLYGTGSEHVVLYQYQLYGAKDVSLRMKSSFEGKTFC